MLNDLTIQTILSIEYVGFSLVLLAWVLVLIIIEWFGLIILKRNKRVTVVKLLEIFLWTGISISITYVSKINSITILFMCVTGLKLLSQLLSALKLYEEWANADLYLVDLLETLFKVLHRVFVERIENISINISKFLTKKEKAEKINNDIDSEVYNSENFEEDDISE